MMSFAKFIRSEKRNEIKFDIYDSVNYKDDDVLYNSCFDSVYSEARILYVIIDKDKNEKYQIYNNIYEEMDIKDKKNNEKINNLEMNNKKINIEFENYRLESDRKEKNYKNEINKLNDKILKTEENHKKELDNVKNNLIIKLNKEKESSKNAQEQLKKKIDDAENNYRKQEEKYKLEKENEIRNEEEAEIEFNNNITEIKYSFYSQFEKEILVKIKKFCLLHNNKTSNEIDLNSNRLVKLLHKNYDKLAQKLFEKVKNELSQNTEDLYKQKIMCVLENSFNDNKHINTMAIGPAGVGKSTLINNILKIKGTEYEAKTGNGKSVTKETKIYSSEKVPILRIYDTPGLDFKIDINTLFKQIKSIVEENLSSNDPDKFINCIWYCVSGKRFNDEEKKFIKEIMKLYSGSYLPIIIVILQSIDENEYENMKNAIIEVLTEEDKEIIKNVNFCNVLSEEIILNINKQQILISSHGIPELLKLTEKLIKSSVESALFQNIKNSIKISSFKFADDLFQSMNGIFEEEINYLKNQKKYLKKKEEDNSDDSSYNSDNNEEGINEEKNEEEEEIKKDYYKNFSQLLSEKLFETYHILINKYIPKKQSDLFEKNIIEDLEKIKTVISEWNRFNSFYEKMIIQESQSLSQKIIEKQNEIDFNKKSKISQKGIKWEKILYDEMIKKYKTTALEEVFKLSFGMFCQGIFVNIKKYVQELYSEILEKKEIKNLLDNKAKKCMENIIDETMKKIQFENGEAKEEVKIIKNEHKNNKKEDKSEEGKEQEEEEDEKSQDAVIA